MSDLQFDPELIRQLREKIRAKQEELAAGPAGVGLVPLKIACTMASCSHGRHCLDYLRRPHLHDSPVAPGSCRDCGAPTPAVSTAAARSSRLVEFHGRLNPVAV